MRFAPKNFRAIFPDLSRGHARNFFGRPKKFLDLASRLGPGAVLDLGLALLPRPRVHRGEKFPVAFLPPLRGKKAVGKVAGVRTVSVGELRL